MPAPYVPQDGDPVILLIALAGCLTLFCVGYIAGRAKTKHDAVPLDTAQLTWERDVYRDMHDADAKTFEKLNEALDELGIVVHDTYAEAIKTEVERLRAIIAEAIETLRTALSEREAAIAAIERGCEDSRQGRVTEMDFSAYAPPVDDEATAIWQRIWYSGGNTTDFIAAIRRGEVPGLTTTAEAQEDLSMLKLEHDNIQHAIYDKLFKGEPAEEREVRWKWILLEVSNLVEERDALKAEVERLRAIIAEASETLRTALSEREAAIARAEKAEESVVMFDEARASAIANETAARAAHAEAMGLLRGTLESLSVIDESLPEMVGRCVHGSFVVTEQSIRDHLAKYDKDASK